MKVIGITGSIATGKSTVTKYLIEHGYLVSDSDKIAYDALTIDKECIEKTIKRFDVANEDGSINRAKLGKIVFNDEKSKADLESIVHPYVIKRLKEDIKNCNREILFLDIPLLFESNLEFLCDEIVVVYCNEQLQLQRLMQRNNFDEKYAKTIMSNQISIEEKKNRATYVIDNSQDLKHLYKEIDMMLKEVK